MMTITIKELIEQLLQLDEVEMDAGVYFVTEDGDVCGVSRVIADNEEACMMEK